MKKMTRATSAVSIPGVTARKNAYTMIHGDCAGSGIGIIRHSWPHSITDPAVLPEIKNADDHFCPYRGKKNIFILPTSMVSKDFCGDIGMGLFDDLGKALKKVEDEVKKSDLDKHLKNVELGLNKAGKDVSMEINKATTPAQPASPAPAAAPAQTPAGRPARSPHPGYQKIAAWMKRNYKDRIAGSGGSSPQGLQLEQLTAEACSGLSAKARKGFMEYLKKQDYEPLLK
jgi:hypothetical protein